MTKMFLVFATLLQYNASRRYIMLAGRLDENLFRFNRSNAEASPVIRPALSASSKNMPARSKSTIPNKKLRLTRSKCDGLAETCTNSVAITTDNSVVIKRRGKSNQEAVDNSKSKESILVSNNSLDILGADLYCKRISCYNPNLPQTSIEPMGISTVNPVESVDNHDYTQICDVQSSSTLVIEDENKHTKVSCENTKNPFSVRKQILLNSIGSDNQNISTSTADLVLEASTNIAPELLDDPAAKDYTRFSFLYFDYGKASKMATFIQDIKRRKNNKYHCSDRSVPLQTHFISRYKHNVSTNDPVTRRFIAKLSRPRLYGNIRGELKKNKGYYIDLEQILKVSKRFGNACSFLDGPELSNHSYENIKDLFLLFLVNTCLCFDNNLQCYILKDSLWEMHVYMSEFYIYILWIFRQFYLEQKHETGKHPHKKDDIIEDMRYICMLLDIYTGIEESKKDPEQKIKQIGMMFIMVEQYRHKIQRHLELLYPKSEVTALYYIAINMLNKVTTKKDILEIKLSKGNRNVKNNDNNHNKKQHLSSWEANVQKNSFKKCNTHYYHNLISADLSKNALFIIAFIVDFAGFAPFKYNLAAIKKLQETNKPSEQSLGRILRLNIMNNRVKYEPFEKAVINFINFLRFIRNKDISSTQKTIDEKYNFINKITMVPIDSKANIHSHCAARHGLNLYRYIILDEMGVVLQ